MDGDLDRRALIALPAVGALMVTTQATAAQAQTPVETIPLWPGRPPGAPAVLPVEQVTPPAAWPYDFTYVTGIGNPRMEVHRPARPNGASALVIAGGGYRFIVVDKEGTEVASRLTAAGFTVFLLRYRLPAEGWAGRSDAPLADVQRAVRLIRANASHLGIDPRKITAMGFSAGGHVAAFAATRHADTVYEPVDAADGLSARPDLSVLAYPVISMAPAHTHGGSRTHLLGETPTPEQEAAYSLQNRVSASTPPTFIVHAGDDVVTPVENALAYMTALRAAKVPFEAHIFEQGGHGFAMRPTPGLTVATWPELFLAWAARRSYGAPSTSR